jgi:MOSC domain-containing protein YiiM
MKIEDIYISPGHNFFGHFGGKSGKNQIIALKEVECVAGKGLRGDRFFGYRDNYQGQVTFFAMEVFDQLCHALKIYDKEPGVLRRNVITSGVDLQGLIGNNFEFQGIRFAGVAECTPCFWMNEAFGPGAEVTLRGCGGLRARILTSGLLRTEP